jgi:hypothetical protein
MTHHKNKRKHPRPQPVETPKPGAAPVDDMAPDWTRKCEVCGQTPIVPLTGLCGPCTFGEAETIGGNW